VLPTVGVQDHHLERDAERAAGGARSDRHFEQHDHVGRPAAGSWVRQQHAADGAAFDYSETLFANNPRDGYTFRPAAMTNAVGGTPVTIREFDTWPCAAWASARS
jgi:hypothetical protein